MTPRSTSAVLIAAGTAPGRYHPIRPTPQQLYNRALGSWRVRRDEEQTEHWKQLADDLLEGRIDAIPLRDVVRIEDFC